MQVRFCPNCSFSERDDDFEINKAYHEGIGRKTCPKCDTWLWSLWIESDGHMEVTDWDENSIHDAELKKLLERCIEVIDLNPWRENES